MFNFWGGYVEGGNSRGGHLQAKYEGIHEKKVGKKE